MPLTDIINKLEKAKKFDLAKETANIINENQDYVRGLLLSQLRRGVDADNKKFKLIRHNGVFPYYSDRTVFEREKKGLQTSIIDYKDTGAFQSTLYVFASLNSFIFDSDVPYFSDIILHAESGDRIIELSDFNLRKLRDELILPQLKIRFNQQ